jgi:hypothetical protein
MQGRREVARKHKLREDDAVMLLLVELFRIHQQHWDDLRRREMPSFEQFRTDIGNCFRRGENISPQHTATLMLLKSQPPATVPKESLACRRDLCGTRLLLAGYLIGRAWP